MLGNYVGDLPRKVSATMRSMSTSMGAYELGERDTWVYVGQRAFEIWACYPRQSLAKCLRMITDDGDHIVQELSSARPGLCHSDEYINGILSVLNKLNSIHLS